MQSEKQSTQEQSLQRLGSEEKFVVYQTRELYNELQSTAGVGGAEGSGIKRMTLKDKERFQKALDLAVTLHINQKDRPNTPRSNVDGRPIKTPYLNHVMGVTLRVMKEYGVYDPEVITAAVLHDSVEDQPEKIIIEYKKITGMSTSGEDARTIIKELFGSRVAQIVCALSNPEQPDGTPIDVKNRAYLEHVREAIEDQGVAYVKLADFSDNALSLHEIGESENARRLKLSIKYEPVVQCFIDRLQRSDIVIPIEKKTALLQKLTEAHISIKKFITDHT